MKKRWIYFMCIAALSFGLCGCNGKEKKSESTLPPVSDEEFVDAESEEEIPYEMISMRIATLKGASIMGMAQIMKNASEKTSENYYEFTISDTVDKLTTSLTNGDVDAAIIPCCQAANLYNQTNGDILIASVSSLGTYSIAGTDTSITSVSDLRGKTIYVVGKDLTSDIILKYMMANKGINVDTDVTVVYKSQVSEITGILSSTKDAVAILSEPDITVLMSTDENIKTIIDINQEWSAINGDSQIVTDVLAVRKSFVEDNEPSFDMFLNEYAESVEYTNANVDSTATILDSFCIYNITEATTFIPLCSIEYFEGEAMQESVNTYLKCLYTQDATFIGGSLPKEDFYYTHNVG